MDKSATGTEYVNAQTMELTAKIDELASKIQGSGVRLVYTKLFLGEYAYIQVALITDTYQEQRRCRLYVRGCQWNGSDSYGDKNVTYYGSMSITQDVIPEGLRPSEELTYNSSIAWRSGSRGGGTVTMNVSAAGRVQVTVDGSGYFSKTFEYLL